MVARAVAMLASLALGGCAAGREGPAAPMAPTDGIPLGGLPRQALGKGQCGIFLWMTGQGARLVLMARSGPPPLARIVLDGRTIDLPRLDASPADAVGEGTARYGDGRVMLSFDLMIERREGLSDGAIAGGSIRIDRIDGEGFVVPVSGLLACG